MSGLEPKDVAAFIADRVEFDTNGGCWLWTRRLDRAGYGRTEVAGMKGFAHRISYAAHNGPLEPGMFVCHKCDVPACVNPAHLSLGTPADNMADRKRRGRDNFSPPRQPKRLSETEVREILAAYDPAPSRPGRINPNSKAQIASRYGVSRFTVAGIINGKAWKRLSVSTGAGQ